MNTTIYLAAIAFGVVLLVASLVIGGKDVTTKDTFEAVEPHNRSHVLATVHKGGAKEVERAIAASAAAFAAHFK